MVIPVILYWNQFMLIDLGMMGPFTTNPFTPFIFPSHKLPNGKYAIGLGDFAFIAYHIIFWSFVRQFMTIHVLRPIAKALGIRGGKIMRFTDQGYALFYFGMTSIAGIVG